MVEILLVSVPYLERFFISVPKLPLALMWYCFLAQNIPYWHVQKNKLEERVKSWNRVKREWRQVECAHLLGVTNKPWCPQGICVLAEGNRFILDCIGFEFVGRFSLQQLWMFRVTGYLRLLTALCLLGQWLVVIFTTASRNWGRGLCVANCDRSITHSLLSKTQQVTSTRLLSCSVINRWCVPEPSA